MILKAFRIQMYKSVLDSDWIDVPQLTVIVGKNESGKTTLLRALHKFNPYKPEPYVREREWPRGHRRQQKDDQVVCTARFELTATEASELLELTEKKVTVTTVEIARDYAGRFEVLFPDGAFPDTIHPNDVDSACDSLPQIPQSVGEPFNKTAVDCQAEARRIAREGRFSEITALAANHAKLLEQVLSPGPPQRPPEDAYRTQHQAKMQELAQKLPGLPSIHSKAHEYIIKRLPTFIYMDDYRSFTGTARLDEVKARKDQGRLTEEDKTLLMILELSGLNLEQEVQKAAQLDREQRQYDLEDAGKTLSREIANRWKQKKYEVQFRADGTQFFTMVEDNPEVGLIRLEERSKGFQWFFSFDLLFMHESKGNFQGCVILLDEPGLHLHPEGQRDLLDRLEAYAKDNTLIYTTHLPFMIDLRQPDRIKVISETPKGASVSDNLTDSQPEAKFTLQAALGISGRTSYLVAERNLVVEGVDDYWILSELSNLFIRSGKTGLPEDVLVTAAGGASEAGYIATFMIGQQLDVAVVLDSDNAGATARDKLVKKWLTRYKAKESQVVGLGPASGVTDRDFAIEDLFPDDFYLGKVKEAHAKQLAAAGVNDLALVGKGLLCDRVERALGTHGIKFAKGSVAKLIRTSLAKMKTVDELPAATKGYAEQALTAICNALPRK